MKKTIVILGTMDTKGAEFGYLREQIRSKGVDTIVVDTGTRGHPLLEPDISRHEVAAAAGKTIEEVAHSGGEAKAIETMSQGAIKIAEDLYRSGKLDGIISLGGSLGTTLGTSVMRALPFGVPKVMVSTIASGDTRNYVGTKDIAMIYSVTDIIGLNRMTKRVLANAAGAIAGMVAAKMEHQETAKPLIAITTLGAMRCVLEAKEILEDAGYEVVVFHTVGSGGRAFEATIEEGLVDGVLDLATNELGNHLFGGALDAGPSRLEAAGKKGIPQVVGPGIIDIVSYTPPEAVPQEFRDRNIIKHNPFMVVVPLKREEMGQIAEVMAKKLNSATGPTAVVMPTSGFSPGGRQGRPFHDPERDRFFISTLKEKLRPDITFVEVDAYINDPIFAQTVTSLLLQLMKKR
jgi:uncharacterized protein (UPF0261 family)